jgi:hypothetical protein
MKDSLASAIRVLHTPFIAMCHGGFGSGDSVGLCAPPSVALWMATYPEPESPHFSASWLFSSAQAI